MNSSGHAEREGDPLPRGPQLHPGCVRGGRRGCGRRRCGGRGVGHCAGCCSRSVTGTVPWRKTAGVQEGLEVLAVVVAREPHLAPLGGVDLRVVPQQTPAGLGAAALAAADEVVGDGVGEAEQVDHGRFSSWGAVVPASSSGAGPRVPSSPGARGGRGRRAVGRTLGVHHVDVRRRLLGRSGRSRPHGAGRALGARQLVVLHQRALGLLALGARLVGDDHGGVGEQHGAGQQRPPEPPVDEERADEADQAETHLDQVPLGAAGLVLPEGVGGVRDPVHLVTVLGAPAGARSLHHLSLRAMGS